jgi:hypothetical protein
MVAKVPEQKQGKQGPGLESQNSFVNFMNDVDAYASAKLTILGDPDWLMTDSTSSLNEVYSKFYGTDGYTLNCNSGQVFVEVDFKEAVDYDNGTGVLSVSDKIMFWDYPKEYTTGPKKIQGVAFMITQVDSSFRGGKFEQTLTMNADIGLKNSTTGPNSNTDVAAGRETTNSTGNLNAANGPRTTTDQGSNGTGQNNTPTSSGSITNNIGFAKVSPTPAVQTNSAASATSSSQNIDYSNLQDIEIASAPINTEVTAPTGGENLSEPVADDDAVIAEAFNNIYNTQPTDALSVNITDAGRETPNNATWTTTWA